MSFLGIGTWEFVLILVLVITVLGPERAREVGVSLGRVLRKMTKSQFWREIIQIPRVIQQLPQNLMRMAALEETQSQLVQDVASIKREFQQVAEPVQALTSNRMLQQPFRAVEADIKKAMTGQAENTIAPPADSPSPAPASPAATPPPAPASPAAATPPKSEPRPSVPAPGPARDDEMVKLVKELTRYADEWEEMQTRLIALEAAQAQLAEQVRSLQTTTDVQVDEQNEDAE